MTRVLTISNIFSRVNHFVNNDPVLSSRTPGSDAIRNEITFRNDLYIDEGLKNLKTCAVKKACPG